MQRWRQSKQEERLEAVAEKKKAKEAVALKRKTQADNRRKAAADKKKFIEYLKKHGYNARQLSPMSFPNLLDA